MSPAERDRIAELGRRRGAELATSVAAKTATLKILGWPEAVRHTREARAS